MSEKELESFKFNFKQITGFDWESHPSVGFKEMMLHLWQASAEFAQGQ